MQTGVPDKCQLEQVWHINVSPVFDTHVAHTATQTGVLQQLHTCGTQKSKARLQHAYSTSRVHVLSPSNEGKASPLNSIMNILSHKRQQYYKKKPNII